MLVVVLRLFCKIDFFIFPKFCYDNHWFRYFCFWIIWRPATCCWLKIRSKSTCFMQLVVLSSVFLRLSCSYFQKDVDFFDNHFQWYFFFDQLESNHVLLAYSKVTENANCYVSRLFCESEFFVFQKIC